MGGCGGEYREIFLREVRHFRIFLLYLASFFVLFSSCFFDHFFDRFGVVSGRHLGSFGGAKIDPRRAKLGSRRVLERYFLQKVKFHEKL